ncbi:MAG: 30S ribosomal protein S20 [Patescibacteria group bacterium]|jgi:small subunit ribosomal protein S20
MPVTKSAKKALLVSIRRKEENDQVRAKVKSAVKKTKISIKNSSNEIAKDLSAAFREVDLAAKKHVMHPNKAARIKSRLALQSVKIDTAPPAPKASKAKK